MNILFIDDDRVVQIIHAHLVKRISEEINYELIYDVKEFIDYNESNSDVSYDVIFVDIKMPKLSGFELLSEVWKSKNCKIQSSRIYLLTSSIDSRDIQRAKSLSYISGFLSKPLTEDLLRKILANTFDSEF